MSELYNGSHRVDSIFQLLGEHENDISYSVSWVLAQCSAFLSCFIKELMPTDHSFKLDFDKIVVRLQQYEKKGGYTDIEIDGQEEFFFVVEAKRGWMIPTAKQIAQYANRTSYKEKIAKIKCLVVLSECSNEYAVPRLEALALENTAIRYLSWKRIVELAKIALPLSSNKEKYLLGELITYMGEAIKMQNIDSNWVYVVALNSGTNPGWGISWIDIVKQRSLYFHPVGVNKWPKEPPNYIAFRYSGKLQSIHHIEYYEIVTNMHKAIPEIPGEEWAATFLYHLGPAIIPAKEVKTGGLYRNGKVWCMLDTLLTCNTISGACNLSKERERKARELS